ncbi:ScyD/ScyE family protein [Nocardioides sp. CN2-186]|uniref:ScyD/ScyE family protein n=1 Tax=Nocardioides tweenelious TaxID=3156607 RepID=UPI0032B4C441
MRTSRLLAALAATAVAGALVAVPSAEAAAPKPKTLTRHLLAPLSVAVDGDDVYVTQNFGGTLNKLRPGKSPKTIYKSKGGNEVGGVSVRKGHVVFTETASDPETGEPSDSWVKEINAKGKVKTLAHMRAYENANNPDSVITYGISDLDEDCAAQWPTDDFGPVSYPGHLDSHPYATYQTAKTVYVADAGMNAVVAITGKKIETVAVTPATDVPITADLATQVGLPDCTVGHTYHGESVPTDVELAPGGDLVVTTEGGGLGEQFPLGAVSSVDPASGVITQLAGHLQTPTGVAVKPNGDLLVAELFAGQISLIKKGSSDVSPYAVAPLPAAVEIAGGDVYATVNVLPGDGQAPDGKVVRYKG